MRAASVWIGTVLAITLVAGCGFAQAGAGSVSRPVPTIAAPAPSVGAMAPMPPSLEPGAPDGSPAPELLTDPASVSVQAVVVERGGVAGAQPSWQQQAVPLSGAGPADQVMLVGIVGEIPELQTVWLMVFGLAVLLRASAFGRLDRERR